ncbi:MAG TPA: FGGY family pentulose kinase [Devosia sp.]|nr:FGGY family pentulose kinase [Devosia sp.]
MGQLLVGVDVGTGSARAGLFSARGESLGRAEQPIRLRRRSAREAEHDSGQIWQAVGEAVQAALAKAGAAPEDVAGIGFDATCSLVLQGDKGAGVTAAPDGLANWDTVVWLDHRAIAEAAECTATGDALLDSLGGVMSPEMQLPKLMWLKRHLPASWQAMTAAFDLADFLTHAASGSLARSESTLACKWGWADGWPTALLVRIGLADLIDKANLPDAPTPPGADLGPLTPEAASALGLTPATRVAAGLVDAHAGALGALGGDAASGERLCLIAGTSNSILALAQDRRPIRGIWGPYRDAILPGLWLLEAGQSATGALLDHLVRAHPAGGEPTADRHAAIAARIAELREQEGARLAAHLHILPDFHGNRAPLAEPGAFGVMSGLTLDDDFDSLARLYWRAALAIALGVRQNLEALGAHGFATDRLRLGGGHVKSPLLRQLYADATGAAIELPRADAMLLGSAMLAAHAAGLYGSVAEAAAAMDQGYATIAPGPERHDRDYRAMLAMQRHRRELEQIVREAE